MIWFGHEGGPDQGSVGVQSRSQARHGQTLVDLEAGDTDRYGHVWDIYGTLAKDSSAWKAEIRRPNPTTAAPAE